MKAKTINLALQIPKSQHFPMIGFEDTILEPI